MKRGTIVLAVVMAMLLSGLQVYASPTEGEIIKIEDEDVPLANIDTIFDGISSSAALTEEMVVRELQKPMQGNMLTFKAVTGKMELASVSIKIEQAAAERMVQEGVSVTFITDLGQFGMDSALLETIAAVGGDVTLSASTGTPLPLDDAIDEEMAVYILTLTDAAGNEINFGGGSMTVTLPWDGKSTKVAYLDDSDENELVEIADAVFKRGNVTFITTHFTTWVLYFETQQAESGRYSSILVGIGLCACVLVLSQIGKSIRRGNV